MTIHYLNHLTVLRKLCMNTCRVITTTTTCPPNKGTSKGVCHSGKNNENGKLKKLFGMEPKIIQT